MMIFSFFARVAAAACGDLLGPASVDEATGSVVACPPAVTAVKEGEGEMVTKGGVSGLRVEGAECMY